MKNRNNLLLPGSIVALVLLYTFVYKPSQKKEKYCGACAGK
jgi:putative effector of murein hydrolase LrgA (UPF0299 family)